MAGRVGVIIGRFHVPSLHDGHKALFRYVLERCDQTAVFLGVSDVDGHTPENPLTAGQRTAMIQRSLANGSLVPELAQRAARIQYYTLQDHVDDVQWSAQIDAMLMALKSLNAVDDVVLYGGRDSFKVAYSGQFPVETVPFALPISGTQIRTAGEIQATTEFLAGQIYSLNHQFPKVHPTVDVALVRQTKTPDPHAIFPTVETLLIQRADNGRWCFPGGFADPGDESYEVTALREVHEELGVDFDPFPLQYVASFKVDDFRYRNSRDKIKTMFFTYVVRDDVEFRPNYGEVQDFRWIALHRAGSIISPTHRPLLTRLEKLWDARGGIQ